MVQTAMQLIVVHVQGCSLEELPWASPLFGIHQWFSHGPWPHFLGAACLYLWQYLAVLSSWGLSQLHLSVVT